MLTCYEALPATNRNQLSDKWVGKKPTTATITIEDAHYEEIRRKNA